MIPLQNEQTGYLGAPGIMVWSVSIGALENGIWCWAGRSVRAYKGGR